MANKRFTVTAVCVLTLAGGGSKEVIGTKVMIQSRGAVFMSVKRLAKLIKKTNKNLVFPSADSCYDEMLGNKCIGRWGGGGGLSLLLVSEPLNFQLPVIQPAWLLSGPSECPRLVTVSVLNY